MTSVSSENERSSRFRFKRKHEDDKHDTDKKGHRHRRHHRHKRRESDSQVEYEPGPYMNSMSNLSSDAAFRESLFDAMGDDEGAEFWSGVYGQPIHEYPNTYRDSETGELERMTDEEYAQYVRRMMWEKSWEGIEAAKEEKRRIRQEEKRKVEKEKKSGDLPNKDDIHDRFLFDLDVEQSLKRGEARRNRRKWEALWSAYQRKWQELQTLHDSYRSNKSNSVSSEILYLRNKMAWPVESGKRQDVAVDEVERFIKQVADSKDDGEQELLAILKTERIRWHPDKVQQRFGFMEIDESTMQGVTAVFQVLDRMWNDQKEKTASRK